MYIKTTDGIKKIFKQCKNGTYLVKGKYRYSHYFKTAQVAETIDELCDAVIIYLKGYEFPVIYDTESFKEYTIKQMINLLIRNKSYMKKVEKIYGAIWTEGDFGEPILKSTAILTKKGNLVLCTKKK